MEKNKNFLVVYFDGREQIRYCSNGDIYYFGFYIKTDINLTTKIKKDYDLAQRKWKLTKSNNNSDL
jgi:hypothetical protein